MAVRDDENEFLVVSRTRRYIELINPKQETFLARALSSKINVCIGDTVFVQNSGNDKIVTDIKPRKNCLTRAYFGKEKQLIANLDLAIVVTAPKPLFNTVFIDRMIAAAYKDSIRCLIVVNKADLSDAMLATQELIEVYRKIGFDVLCTSTKTEHGLDSLKDTLRDPTLAVAGFAGLSGVGKSTILNHFIPHASARTQTVSQKSGHGRQTTTQPYGYLYQRANVSPLLLVDLPGLQNFGVSHLTRSEILKAFVEFQPYADKCEYRDCLHTVEPDCALLNALHRGEIEKTRYNSYLNMLEEIQNAREY